MMKRAMWSEKEISVNINNGGILSIFQDRHDGEVVMKSSHYDEEHIISAPDFVMLMNLYRNIKDPKYKDDINVYAYISQREDK